MADIVSLKAQQLAGLAFDMLNASKKKSLVKPFHSLGLQDNYLPTEVKKVSFQSQIISVLLVQLLLCNNPLLAFVQ